MVRRSDRRRLPLGATSLQARTGASRRPGHRWSDAGRLRSFDPGGQRRFCRSRTTASGRPLAATRRSGAAIRDATRLAGTISTPSARSRSTCPGSWDWPIDGRFALPGDGDTYSATVSSASSYDARPAGLISEAALRGARDYGVLAGHLGLRSNRWSRHCLPGAVPPQGRVAARRRGFDSRETIDLQKSADRALDQVLWRP